jgi:hypothetical protein
MLLGKHLSKTLRTRLNYCLEYESEPLKEIVLRKWKSIHEFVRVCGLHCESVVCLALFQTKLFQNFQDTTSFANKNNMESFNKIIKAFFTHFVDHRLLINLH